MGGNRAAKVFTHISCTFGMMRAAFGPVIPATSRVTVMLVNAEETPSDFAREVPEGRAKAGVMRRLSMTALRSTARHVLRGLAIVGPSCIHQRNAREAARRAHLDAFGANRGAPWRDPTNGG